MKSGKNFRKTFDGGKWKISGNYIFSRQRTIPVLVLITLSLFTGSAFSPLANGQSTKNVSLSLNIIVNPFTAPNDSLKEQQILTMSFDPPPETPPSVKSDLGFISYRYHSWDIPDEITAGSNFWIEVDLTNQILYAYRDNQLINGFKVSTGTSSHKTITGTFKIFSKYPAITMTGPGYDLPDVPFSMFFYKGYALHGTYWHHNFGTPMSHGCVNMNTDDAAWIYENAPVGTYVMVHY